MKEVLIKNIIKLIIGGLMVGLLHKYDLIVAILIFIKLLHSFYKNYKKNQFSIVIVIGFIITGLIGLLFEYLGTEYGYWEYHNVDRQVPRWLFFAWGGAFITIYQIELQLYTKIKSLSEAQKKLLTFFMVAILPAFGEAIAINLGTWTYYIPYQIFGVPLAAIIALTIIHYTLHVVLSFTTKRFDIKDLVFNPKKI